jgi:hypothetical protein
MFLRSHCRRLARLQAHFAMRAVTKHGARDGNVEYQGWRWRKMKMSVFPVFPPKKAISVTSAYISSAVFMR